MKEEVEAGGGWVAIGGGECILWYEDSYRDLLGMCKQVAGEGETGLRFSVFGFQIRQPRRGFTMHEHLKDLGLIHMYRRVYDPLIGRFLSAYPHIQAPGDLQNYNRYSYVNNNPLSFTDPTGFFLKKLFKKIGRFFKKYWRPIVAIVATVVAAGAFLALYYGSMLGGVSRWSGMAAMVKLGIE